MTSEGHVPKSEVGPIREGFWLGVEGWCFRMGSPGSIFRNDKWVDSKLHEGASLP